MKGVIDEITFEGVLEALRDNPRWLEALREIILTEDLLQLPQRFEEFQRKFEEFQSRSEGFQNRFEGFQSRFEDFIEEDFIPLRDKVDKIEQDVAVLKQDVNVLKQDVKVLKNDVATLKGDVFEQKVRDKAATFFGKLLRRTRLITTEQYVDALDNALEGGLITEQERDDAINADVVVRGRVKGTEREVIVVCEVSNKVDLEDVERASRRAEITAKAYRQEAIGVVLGKEITERARESADKMAVLIL